MARPTSRSAFAPPCPRYLADIGCPAQCAGAGYTALMNASACEVWRCFGESAFAACVAALVGVIGHADPTFAVRRRARLSGAEEKLDGVLQRRPLDHSSAAFGF